MTLREHSPPAPQYVAVDRDGTVLKYVPYLTRIDDVRLSGGAGPAIARLNRVGTRVVLVSNQSVVSRGDLTFEALDAIHGRMSELLAEHDAFLDEVLVCPHSQEAECECRKPRPGLLDEYLIREGLSSRDGYVVGDNASDIQLALNIGAKPVHVQGGVHSKADIGGLYASVPSVANLCDAVSLILGGQEQ